MSFTCSVCGRQHDEVLRDIRAELPDAVFALDEAEREERADWSDDWCRLTEGSDRIRHFVRGVLHLPIHGQKDDFRFGVWVEVDGADFFELGEHWREDDPRPTRPYFGRLANELALYAGTTGLPLALQPRTARHLPAVILLDDPHPIVNDQRLGISSDRADRLAERVLH